MKQRLRDYFDRQLERVLAELPPRIHELLDVVTLYVEDHPARRVLEETQTEYRDELCGYYAGIPLTERHVEQAGTLSDAIYLYREGILSLVEDETGGINGPTLRREIRTTILHELGHHHGMTEEELEALGYE